MKVLLTGVKGQLGKTISLLKPNNLNLIEISRKELDLENPRKCFELISSPAHNPKVLELFLKSTITSYILP